LPAPNVLATRVDPLGPKSGPRDVALGDFNGDGISELAISETQGDQYPHPPQHAAGAIEPARFRSPGAHGPERVEEGRPDQAGGRVNRLFDRCKIS
jgi:hypothetical protein